jgi:hypothetical protein
LETPKITPEMLDRAALVLQECASDLEVHKGKLS